VNNIILINGPNINLLGKREQSQYGSMSFDELKKNCVEHSKQIGVKIEFFQSNLEGEIVEKIQESIKSFDGIIINAAGYTHTSVSIRDALSIYKKPKIELHISNIYKREEFRQKSLISDVVTGIICGLGSHGYILAINAMHELLKNEN
jgi:3-dehydroquinate dehydratase-2|tara:strand:- start:693 stop:1136 length:444 start_codon:yes stop_codon:yes gene_type:complete